MAVLTISAMLLAAVGGIYIRMRQAANSVNRQLQSGRLDMEILQRLAEDIDRTALSGADIMMTIKNKIEEGGYNSAQMIIENKIYDKDSKEQVFDRIVWQSRANVDANGLIIYRAHSGYSLEDKMLDETKDSLELEKFVPVCSGVTMFKIETVKGEEISQKWDKKALPLAVKVSLSFANMAEDISGNMVVPEEDIIFRTIAVNRARQLTYKFIKTEFADANEIADMYEDDANDANDSNLPGDVNDVNDVTDEFFDDEENRK